MIQPLGHYTSKELNTISAYPRSKGDGCRKGYGAEVIKHWGSDCAYCGKDLLEDYESWLHLSVDHVVPSSVLKSWGSDYRKWVESRSNIVPCCRACNEFLNGYRVATDAPKDKSAFMALRNRALREKRDLALKKHEQEKLSYERLRRADLTASTSPSVGSDAITQRITRSRIARLPSDASFRC